jgi:hypothetical protein
MNVGGQISGNNWSRLRTGYTTGSGRTAIWRYGIPMDTLIQDNTSIDTYQSGMSTHQAGWGQTFIGNHIADTGSHGTIIRSKYAKVSGNHILRTIGAGIKIISDGSNIIAEGTVAIGNVLEETNQGATPEGVDQTDQGAIDDNSPDGVYTGNTIRKCAGPAVQINFTRETVFKGNTIIDPCQLSATHSVEYAIGGTSAGTGSPWWVVDSNVVISTDGLCTIGINKPDGVFVQGANNTTRGIVTPYSGERLNTSLGMNGRPNFGSRDTDETIVGGVLALNALSITGSIISLRAESGSADDLNTITGGVNGDEIILRPIAGNTITVVNGAGFGTDNIRTNDGSNLAMTYATGGEKLYRFVKDNQLWIRTS